MANTKIPSELIADSSITAAKLADGTITTADIADSNVTTAKIADSNVTTAKIGDAQVTTAKITDANVTTGKIADSNVTTAKIADNNVTSAKLASGITLAGTTTLSSISLPYAEITSTSGSTIIDSSSSYLILEASNVIMRNSAGNEDYAKFIGNGAVNLYHNNFLKLATTSTGIDVTGTATMDAAKVETGTTSTVTISESTGSGTAELRFVATDSFPKTKIVTDVSAGSLSLETLGNDRLKIANNGDISFYEDTGSTAKLFWDASAELLGIGTTSPAQKLDIAGTAPNIRFTDTRQITWSGDEKLGGVEWYTVDTSANGPLTGASIYCENSVGSTIPNFNMVFATQVHNNASAPIERMRISSDGNVGIGTDAPTFGKLEVNGPKYVLTDSGQARGGIHVSPDSSATSGQYGGAISFSGGGSGSVAIASINDGGSDHDSVGLAFITHAQGTGSADAEEKMRITEVGNVGIGTPTPYYPFNVHGANIASGEAKTTGMLFDTTSATAGTGGGLALGGYSNGTGGDIYHFGNIQGIKENSTAGNYASAMIFSTRANGATPLERMRIDSSGKVGIGKTPNTWHLDVDSSDIYIASFDGSNNKGIVINSMTDEASIVGYSNSANAYNKVNIRGAAGIGLVVDTSNKVGIGTTSPTSALMVTGGAAVPGISIKSGGNSGVDPFRVTYVNGTEGDMFIIDDSGNVGIGTTAPAYKLDISGTSNDLTPLIRGTASNTPSGGFNWATEFIAANLANDKRLTHIWGKARTNYGMAHVSYLPKSTASESYLALGLWGANDILNVLGNGKVGIGTTDPDQKLEVVGTIHQSGSGVIKQGNSDGTPRYINIPYASAASGFSFNWDDLATHPGVGDQSSETNAFMFEVNVTSYLGRYIKAIIVVDTNATNSLSLTTLHNNTITMTASIPTGSETITLTFSGLWGNATNYMGRITTF